MTKENFILAKLEEHTGFHLYGELIIKKGKVYWTEDMGDSPEMPKELCSVEKLIDKARNGFRTLNIGENDICLKNGPLTMGQLKSKDIHILMVEGEPELLADDSGMAEGFGLEFFERIPGLKLTEFQKAQFLFRIYGKKALLID